MASKIDQSEEKEPESSGIGKIVQEIAEKARIMRERIVSQASLQGKNKKYGIQEIFGKDGILQERAKSDGILQERTINDVIEETVGKDETIQETVGNDGIQEIPANDGNFPEVNEKFERFEDIPDDNENGVEIHPNYSNPLDSLQTHEGGQETREGFQLTRDASEDGIIRRETSVKNGIRETLTHYQNFHEIAYEFEVINLHRKKAWNFEVDFSTKCKEWPTLWTCGMLFKKMPGDSTATVLFNLTKNGFDDRTVKLHISLLVQDATNRNTFLDKEIKNALPYGIISEHYHINLTTPEQEYCFAKKSVVNVVIKIYDCHFTICSTA